MRSNGSQVCHSSGLFNVLRGHPPSTTSYPTGEQLRCPTNDTIMHCGFEKYTPLAATYGIAVSAAFFAVEVRVAETANIAAWVCGLGGELFGLLIFQQRQLILYLQMCSWAYVIFR